MPPLKGEEACEHVERVSAIAWSNGAYKATEALKAENARLKTEIQHLMVFCNCTLIPNKELQEQVERLTKAGDAVYQVLAFRRSDPELTSMVGEQWHKAKEGKQP